MTRKTHPFDFEERRRVIVRFGLSGGLSFRERISVINVLIDKLLPSPNDLPPPDLTNIKSIIDSDINFIDILKIWQASSIDFNPHRNSPGGLDSLSDNDGLIAQSLRRKDMGETRYAINRQKALSALALPSNFGALEPAGNIKQLAASSASSEDINIYLNNGVALNVDRRRKDSPNSAASGIRRYSAFCDLIGVANFPPCTAIVKRWGSVFNPGKTYGLYVSRLAKSCQILDIPADWYGDSAHVIATCVQNIRDVSLRLGDFISKAILSSLLDYEVLNSEIGRIFPAPSVFLLRAQSEALPLSRDSPNGHILGKSPMKVRDLMGARDVATVDRPVIKLQTRKNLRRVPILTRPCS